MDGTTGAHGHGGLTAGAISRQGVRDSALPGNRDSGHEGPVESLEHGRECGEREAALGAGPQHGKQQEQGSAEAEEARPVLGGSAGCACWRGPGAVGSDPGCPWDGSQHPKLTLPICSNPQTGLAETLLGCERAFQTIPAPILVLLVETEIRSSPLESITFTQWSCCLKSSHQGCTFLLSVALVMQAGKVQFPKQECVYRDLLRSRLCIPTKEVTK